MISIEELFCIGIAIVAFVFLVYLTSGGPPDPPASGSYGGGTGEAMDPATQMVAMDLI